MLAIGGWIYFMQPSQGLNVGIQLTATPANVLVGDQFTVSVALINNAGSALKNASIALVLPSNAVSVDSPTQRVVSQSLGSINAGGVSHEDFHIIITGSPNALAHFTAKVTYAAADSSAQFENDGTLDVPVGGPAISLNMFAPGNVFSGQNFPVTVNYNNNTDHAISGMSLAMQYPPAFSFVKASSSLATIGNSSWNLGTIPANGSGAVTITGNLVGSASVAYPIGALLSENIGGQNYTIASPTTNVSLAESPLSFSISVNNAQNYISTAGDSLNYTLTFTNNSTVTFQNIIIFANLAGGMFDFSSLQSNGSFNSNANMLSWNGAAVPSLLSLAPGQSGSVNFFIRTKNAFPIRLLSDKNYSISVSAKLQSPTVPAGTAASSTISVANITTKLHGSIVLGAQAYWRESSANTGGSMSPSGIPNSGPYPPKVNQKTQYTVHWLLTNYATDADNVTISAYLQSGTTCTGAVKSPASSTFSCDPSNGEVTWQIPVVAATTGITGKPLEAIFQVVNTPAVNQINQDVTLMGAATLTATDGFTSSTMQSSAQAITTALPNDTSVSTQQRQVTQ